MNTGKLVLGVLAGAAVGALVGVLLAPDKGSETRKKIAKKGSDTIEGLKGQLDDLLCSFNEKIESAKDEVADMYEKGKEKADTIKKEARA
jgi:gas vesicle protein